jgi:hypothetical protein
MDKIAAAIPLADKAAKPAMLWILPILPFLSFRLCPCRFHAFQGFFQKVYEENLKLI